MSRVEEIFNNIGNDTPVGFEGAPAQSAQPQDMPDTRYRMTKKDLMKALEKMPDEAAIWNTVPGQGEYDAKNAIRDALWSTLAPAVRKMVKAPTGEYIESRS
jgi:hypothetical protein